MGRKLYVGNLAFSVTSDSLNSLFAQFGTVESAKVITDRDTGRSKGFAFVEMSTDDEAAACIREVAGRELEGRQLNISEAKPQEPRSGGGGFGRSGGGGGFNRGGGRGGRY
ncbi:MAG: RNA-binding protein [Bdellovibrionales bacterium RBG_16_40_8]|nr:MAG: RNA-binding protein [Bdellovibrionales bacterium RBG_16_40_8]